MAIVADRNRPQKHAARVRIILHSAERLDVAKVIIVTLDRSTEFATYIHPTR